VDVSPVDPRDVEGEDHGPVYRVYFWESTTSTEYRLVGADDVDEVLAWAEANVRHDQTYELFVEVTSAHSVRLVRLSGCG
jgi:hypothetical protein